jgi:hypothetical protein
VSDTEAAVCTDWRLEVGYEHVWMRPCTLRIASAEDDAKATSLHPVRGDRAPWCRAAPAALLIHIKPLDMSSVE